MDGDSTKMKVQDEVVTNGTDSDGDSLRLKIKSNIDGFGIVCHKKGAENGNGVHEDSDDEENDSKENSENVSLSDEASRDAEESRDNSINSSKVQDEDSNEAGKVDTSRDESMDVDGGDVESLDDSAVNSVEPSNENTRDSIEPSNENTRDSIEPSNENTRESVEPSNENTRESVEPSNENTRESIEPSNENTRESIEPSNENTKESVEPSNENTKESIVSDDKDNSASPNNDKQQESEKNATEKCDDQSEKKKKSESMANVSSKKGDVDMVVIEDSPIKEKPSSPKQPTKVDRMLANEKSHGAASTGSEGLRPFARLLFDIGLDLTRQNVYKDLIKVQSKKQSHNKLSVKEEEQLEKLKDAHSHLLDRNKFLALESRQCSKCNFKSNSLNALEYHKEFDHKGACAMCEFVTGNASAYYFHMEAEHNRQGRVQPILASYVCPYCPYEHHSARKNYLRHVEKCERNFSLKRNLQPMPADCDIPLKPQAVTNIKQRVLPQLAKKPDPPRPPVVRPQAPSAAHIRNTVAGFRPGQPISQLPSWLNIQVKDNQAPQLVQMGSQYFLVVNQNGQTFMTPIAAGANPPTSAAVTSSIPIVPAKPALKPAPSDGKATTITPKGAFEICEICGGFVKDRDSLRIHFFWAHKIEIHPSLMKDKDPVLKCNNPSCTRRFWTYQGYQRHVSITHGGLATKAPTPGMTCYVCGVHTDDFITHMTSKHPQVVKHMLSQMRCVVCQDSQPTESALETHMFSEHKDVVTRYGSLVGSKSKSSDEKKEKSPTAVPTGVYENSSGKKLPSIQCTRCDKEFNSAESLAEHFAEHSDILESCIVCDEEVQVGKKTLKHYKDNHLKDMSIPVKRLPKEMLEKHASRKRRNSDDVIVIDLDDKKKQKLVDESDEIENGDEEGEKNVDDDAVEIIEDDEDKENDDSRNEPMDDAESEETKSKEDDENDDSKEAEEEEGSCKKIIEEIIEVDGEKVIIQKVTE